MTEDELVDKLAGCGVHPDKHAILCLIYTVFQDMVNGSTRRLIRREISHRAHAKFVNGMLNRVIKAFGRHVSRRQLRAIFGTDGTRIVRLVDPNA